MERKVNIGVDSSEFTVASEVCFVVLSRLL